MREIYSSEYLNNDIGTSVLVFFISILTTIGGVGGGGLLIPTYLLLGRFSLSQSVPLSIMTIFGDTLVRLVYLYPKHHPFHKKRSIIDLTPLLLIIPFDGNTSFIGVILANTLPEIIRLLSIIIVLGLTLWKTIIKACEMLDKEDKYLRKLEHESELEMIVIDGLANYIPKKTIEKYTQQDGKGDTLTSKYINTFICMSSISVIGAFSFMRQNISLCNISYYYYIIGQFGFIIIFGSGVVYYLRSSYERKKNNDYIFLEGDIVWKRPEIVKFISIGSLTGFVSTYMGIGGGMLITPIMFNVGMIPEVVVASSSVSTFFSSIISLINYLQTPDLLWKHGIVFGTISAGGSVIGLALSNFIIKRFKRQSIIIFIVNFILLLSIILLVYNGLTSYNLTKYNVRSICSV